jgi:hypothetical protein
MRPVHAFALLGLVMAPLGACQTGVTGMPGPSVGATSEPLGAPPRSPRALRMAADDPRLLEAAGQDRIALPTTRYLLARLLVPNLSPGVHWAHYELYTPTGALYQERHVPYALGRAPATVASPDGVPHPIDVEHAQSGPDGVALDLSILVGGTNLQRRPQPGLWRLHAALDRAPATAADATFELTLAP